MTTALEGGEWSAARPGRTLPPEKTRYSFYRRMGGPQGRSGRAENLVPTGIRSRTVQPIVSRYTDWATRSTFHLNNTQIFSSYCISIIRTNSWCCFFTFSVLRLVFRGRGTPSALERTCCPAHAIKAYTGSRGIPPLILNFSSIWRWMELQLYLY